MFKTLIALLLTYMILRALFRLWRPNDSDNETQRRLDRATQYRLWRKEKP